MHLEPIAVPQFIEEIKVSVQQCAWQYSRECSTVRVRTWKAEHEVIPNNPVIPSLKSHELDYSLYKKGHSFSTSYIVNKSSSSVTTNASRRKPIRVHFKDENTHGDDIHQDSDGNNRLPLNNVETFLHLLKSLLGTGILAMPKAFFYAGWLFGIIGSVVLAVISTYCVHLLLRSQYEVCRRLKVCNLSYGDAARNAMLEGPSFCVRLAKGFGLLTSFFLVADQIGTCCVYIIFVASNLKGVVDEYIEPLDIRIYMLLLLIPLLSLNFIRSFKYLTPFSTVANLIMLISFGITFYYVFRDMPSLSERKAIGYIGDLPLFGGMVLFSMEAIGMVLPLRNDMKNPKSFGGICGILNQVMVILVIAYITIGFFGYVKYGDDTKGSITLNLPDKDGLAQSARVMLSCSVLLSHALQCYVIIDIIWTENLSYKFFSSPWKLFMEYTIRVSVVVLTLILAVAVPNIELFISLVGALCVTLLAILFPVIMETSTFWYTTVGFRFYFMCFKNMLLALFGLFALTVGVYTSSVEIFHSFASN